MSQPAAPPAPPPPSFATPAAGAYAAPPTTAADEADKARAEAAEEARYREQLRVRRTIEAGAFLMSGFIARGIQGPTAAALAMVEAEHFIKAADTWAEQVLAPPPPPPPPAPPENSAPMGGGLGGVRDPDGVTMTVKRI